MEMTDYHPKDIPSGIGPICPIFVGAVIIQQDWTNNFGVHCG
jgi:hypothetical protein